MKHRRPTRADVALKAGVAPSTVTLILTDRGDGLRIPEATQRRVREAARAMGYYPNRHIQSVLRGRSEILGLYLRADQYGRPYGYWATVLWCLQKASAELEIQMLVHNAPAGASTEEIFARQAGGIVDGVMIVNSGQDPIVGRILEAKLPAVEVGDPFSPLPFVGLDSTQGINLVMRHLKERGCKRPAIVSYRTCYVENAEARIHEFERCARELFAIDEPERRSILGVDAMEAFPHLMALEPRPDCVVCGSDELAYEILTLCHRAGLKVPGDLAVTGYDCLTAMGTDRVLTSVATPLEEMARLAFHKLHQVIEGQPHEHDTLLPVGLRVGDTT